LNTEFASSLDGTRIAFDVTGQGPVIMLLHGGGHNRQKWHEIGYIERLHKDFKIITIDIRGNGESDKPIDSTFYTTAKMCQDLLAVADACGANRFAIWGFSYGANIGRYLAAQSDRVSKIILIGIPFGLGASGDFRRSIEDFRSHWTPIVESQHNGTLNLESLSDDDRSYLQGTNVPVTLAWLSAMLDWRAIEPADIRCSTLCLVGSQNEIAMASLKEYEESLKASNVQVHVIEGLNHLQEFTEIDQVLPVMLAFTKSQF
jgi:pimeloyl-ACP methyl ester carboxylesterase